jgi:acyl carrier protein
MGLDGVELVMEVEKNFGIQIPDSEAEKIITVGDMYDAVWRHLEGRHNEKCKSQALFYKLRQSFAQQFQFPPKELLLQTSPAAIFPEVNRREAYKRFAGETNLKLPSLVLTQSWSILLNVFGWSAILGSLVIALILINFFDYSKWLLLAPVAGIFITGGISEWLEPLRTKIAEPTMRLFIERTLAMNFAGMVNDSGTNRKEMESVINHIIVDKIGVEMEEIAPDKKFGDDLGVD